MILSTVLAAKNAVDDAKEKFDEVKDKLAKLNPKRTKAMIITFFVISLVISCAALAVAIIALVKSCKNECEDCLVCCGDDDDDVSFLYPEGDADDFDYTLNEINEAPDANMDTDTLKEM